MTATCNRCGATWARDPALAVPCPKCRAPAGSRCRRPSGHECELHADRDAAALAAGLIEPCPALAPSLACAAVGAGQGVLL